MANAPLTLLFIVRAACLFTVICTNNFWPSWTFFALWTILYTLSLYKLFVWSNPKFLFVVTLQPFYICMILNIRLRNVTSVLLLHVLANKRIEVQFQRVFIDVSTLWTIRIGHFNFLRSCVITLIKSCSVLITFRTWVINCTCIILNLHIFHMKHIYLFENLIVVFLITLGSLHRLLRAWALLRVDTTRSFWILCFWLLLRYRLLLLLLHLFQLFLFFSFHFFIFFLLLIFKSFTELFVHFLFQDLIIYFGIGSLLWSKWFFFIIANTSTRNIRRMKPSLVGFFRRAIVFIFIQKFHQLK